MSIKYYRKIVGIMKITKILISCLTICIFSTSLLTGCKSNNVKNKDGKQQVEVFLSKAEAINTFKNFEEKFEEQNPDIDVVISSPAQPMTVLKTRLVKNDVPDILTIAGEMNYGDFVDAGILEDLSNEKDIIDRIQPAYVNVLKSLEFESNDTLCGIPYACNAGGVVYNKDIFEKLKLKVPTTWDEFIDTAEKIKEAEITPFYFTLKDAWTAMPAWNAITANTQSEDFFIERRKNEVTFRDEYKPIAEKMETLMDYGHNDNFGIGYNDGNVSFAQGNAAMMIQGNWVIPEILKINPNINLGMFVLPTNNDASKNSIVSGIDLLFAVPKESKNKEAAIKFLDFMTKSENVEQYAKEQFAIPAIKDMYQKDKTVEDLNPYFKNGMVLDFPDHHYPASMQVGDLAQAYLFDKDIDKLLNSLDDRWNRSQQ
ncbi:extracellular solute-binding protein [Clostridium botulinum]|nr:extracellular solute-binding protein [Clostridium botulinum]NFJ38992.1 extracellular solute-binding protein [Clostridium botulinum B str. Eklund 17B (NRP)]MBY7001886.1 extracellular solute-binding protein [Clostridium botulinum]NFD71117.1 extracellular solute-binding protein [Clostridium botulinum]NFF32864.1 extracellular solute-binding protein [Clostridium botulinum]